MYVGTQENAARGNFLFRCDPGPAGGRGGPFRCSSRALLASFAHKVGKKPGALTRRSPLHSALFALTWDDDQREAKSAPFRSVRPDRDATVRKAGATQICRSDILQIGSFEKCRRTTRVVTVHF